MDLTRRLKPTHLRLVARIAETGKLQIAADASGVSQPAASRILAEIEAEIGAVLFTRHPKGMVPTAVGEAFVRHARVILTEFDDLVAEVRGIETGEAGEVRVGSVSGPAVAYLVPALRRMKLQAPAVETTFEVGPSTELVRGLGEGRFDFVIARLPPGHDGRELHAHPARGEVVKLLVRATHPCAGRAKVGLADLARYEWVIQERGSPIRQAVEETFLAGAVPIPTNITNTSSLLVVLAILARSDAVAPQSEEVAEMLVRGGHGPALVALDLDRPIAVTPYFVIHKRARQMPRAAERVLEEVLAALGGDTGALAPEA
jgi:DNA-binding transcriptional LysR family regulator